MKSKSRISEGYTRFVYLHGNEKQIEKMKDNKVDNKLMNQYMYFTLVRSAKKLYRNTHDNFVPFKHSKLERKMIRSGRVA